MRNLECIMVELIEAYNDLLCVYEFATERSPEMVRVNTLIKEVYDGLRQKKQGWHRRVA